MLRRPIVCLERNQFYEIGKALPHVRFFSNLSLIPSQKNVPTISAKTSRTLALAKEEGGINSLPDQDEILLSKHMMPPDPKFIPIDCKATKLEVGKSEDLYVDDEKYLKSSDYTKYERVRFARYFGKCPEGVPQSMRKDFILYDPNEKDFGVMIRPQTLQLMRQMELFSKEKNVSTGDYKISSRGFLIDGPRGSGKSVLLNHLAWWALEHNWIVLYFNQPDEYLVKSTDIVRSSAGIYVQSEFACRYLDKLVKSNGDKLSRIPVDMSIYGNCGLDGSSQPHILHSYDSLIHKTVTNELRRQLGPAYGKLQAKYSNLIETLHDNTLKSLELMKRQMYLKHQIQQTLKITTLRSVLPNPTTLLDIANKGFEHEAYSTACLSEIIKQLKNQSVYPVLIAIDNWTSLFKVSKYLSTRYDSTKFNGYIPGYHLALPRLLSKWDGHQFKRGIKICATSWLKDKQKGFVPRLLGVNSREIIRVANFTPREFDNLMKFGASKGAIVELPRYKIPYFYMMTNGNGELARKTLATFY